MNLPPLPPLPELSDLGDSGATNYGYNDDDMQEYARQAQREAVAAYKAELFKKYEVNTERATEAEGEAFTHGYFCGEREAVAAAVPEGFQNFPSSNSSAAEDAIGKVLEERNFPCNPRAAARCGWEAAHRVIKSLIAAAPGGER